MAHYKKYIFASILLTAVSTQTLHAAAMAGTSAATGAGDAVPSASLKPLTMGNLATDFKPKAGASGAFKPDAEEVLVAGGYVWGSEVKAATTGPLVDFLEEKNKEGKLPIDLGKAGVKAHAEAMHQALSNLLTEDAQIFAALAEVRRHMSPGAGKIAASKLTVPLPAAFNVAGCFAFAGAAADAEETVSGKAIKPLKPVKDLFAGWAGAGEGLFEPAASALDNMSALYNAVLKLMGHTHQARGVYATERDVYEAAKRKAMAPDEPKLVKATTLKGSSGDYAAAVMGVAPDMDALIRSAVTARTRELEASLARVTAELESVRSASAAAAKDLERKHVQAIAAAKEAEIRKAAAILEDERAEKVAAQAAASEASAALRELQAPTMAEIASLKDEIERLTAERDGMKAHVASSEAALARVAAEREENAAIRAKAAAAERTAAEAKARSAAVMAELEATKALLTKAVADYNEQVKLNGQFFTSSGALKAENARLQAQIVSLQAQVGALEAQVSSLSGKEK